MLYIERCFDKIYMYLCNDIIIYLYFDIKII